MTEIPSIWLPSLHICSLKKLSIYSVYYKWNLIFVINMNKIFTKVYFEVYNCAAKARLGKGSIDQSRGPMTGN